MTLPTPTAVVLGLPGDLVAVVVVLVTFAVLLLLVEGVERI